MWFALAVLILLISVLAYGSHGTFGPLANALPVGSNQVWKCRDECPIDDAPFGL
jgi:hypothetical protein